MTPAERRALMARAHRLDPVVMIGGKGLTDAVIAEIDRALKSHELIKVRAPAMERDDRAAAAEAICTRTGAELVQRVGKVMVLFRRNPD